MRALVAVLVVVAAASAAQAAPWAFELPAGYTEVPGSADAWAKQEHVPNTISFDGLNYTSPGGDVILSRLSYLIQPENTPTRALLVEIDASLADNNASTQRVAEGREFHGDQLIGETIAEKQGVRIHERRILAADTNGIVHGLHVICLGKPDKLADCEAAQKTAEIILANQAKLASGQPTHKQGDHTMIQRIAIYAFGALVLGLVVWLVQSLRRGQRPRRRGRR
jgi:hypothetical protein